MRYSKPMPGDEGNYNWEARFDKDGSYLGISQTKEDGILERVLLSAGQVRALLKFLGASRSPKRKAAPHA